MVKCPDWAIGEIRSDLTSAASRRKVVLYGDLMRKYHLSRGRVLSHAIGEVDRVECMKGRPGFAAIIVRKDTGFPGGGYFCDEGLPPRLRRPGNQASNPRLSQAEQRYIKRQQQEIWAYYSNSARRT